MFIYLFDIGTSVLISENPSDIKLINYTVIQSTLQLNLTFFLRSLTTIIIYQVLLIVLYTVEP